MKRNVKNQILSILSTLEDVHAHIRDNLKKGMIDSVVKSLEDCQGVAIDVGTTIEDIEGGRVPSVIELEKYAELLYQSREEVLNNKKVNPSKIYRNLNKYIIDVRNKVDEIEVLNIKEVVFLPYKASMWDSFETVWQDECEKENVSSKVIPIPYYDRNPDGSLGEEHYEIDKFPDYVPVIDYREYDFEMNEPDEIYIHNPYDDYNAVTSVHPFFYSKNLKKFTDKLIYIPYFVLNDFDIENEELVEKNMHFVTLPGVFNADITIVQSEKIKEFYLKCLEISAGKKVRHYFEDRIVGTGSPKIERVKRMQDKGVEIPEAWKKIIYKTDGTKKKVIFYNNGISALLINNEKMINKIDNVFDFFDSVKDEVTLLWRPHPLLKATIKSMRPQLIDGYNKLLEKFHEKNIGIYDDTPDMTKSLVISDAYYGDSSSIVVLCKAIEKPVMIQNVNVLEMMDN